MNTFIIVKFIVLRESTAWIFAMNITIAMGVSDLESPMYTELACVWHAHGMHMQCIKCNVS